ncbi:hypothetical protein [Paenibacillus lutrae]|uniref:Butirosin biosynthesis protein H N-terminal domain-containing protein n=1 Tax=Paenibacillus lutrae TaxID=2078573 RepID=A0A7X3FGX5_9BACL|nr:hypothetical protein [Paenibacillus lutrae]MVO99548.1 hypothetical protein [Paenibacillus lutrae]
MFQDMQPVRGISTDCLQDMIITLCNYWNRDYELAFSETMGFNFIWAEDKLIGECVTNSRTTSFDLLQDYHGVAVQEHIFPTSHDVFKMITASLENRQAILIQLDSFWNPWGNAHAYQQEHNYHHACLVVGVEKDQTDLYCVDSTFSNQIERLPIDHFFQGNNGRAATIERIAPVHTDLSEAYGRIRTSVIQDNHYEAFYDLADAFEKKMNLDQEIAGCHELWDAPIFQKIDTIYFGRNYHSKALQYLASHNPLPSLHKTLEALLPLASRLAIQWEITQKNLIKYYYVNTAGKDAIYRPKIAGIIRENAKLEEEFFNLYRLA